MRRTFLAASAGAVVAAVAIGGIAWATTGAPGGVIRACYQKNNGQLRIADSAGTCSSSELALE